MKSDELIADEILSDARHERELNTDRDPAELRAAIVRALQAARESAIDTHANGAVLRMCHEARMMNGIVDYSDPKEVGVVRKVKAYDTLDGRIWEEWHKRHEIEPMTLEQVHAAGLRLPDGFTDAADFINQVRGQIEAAEAAKEGKA